MNIVAILLYAALSAGGLIAIKFGSDPAQGLMHIGKLVLPVTLPTLIGIGLYGTSFLIYLFLISKFDLGYIIPLTTALVYIIIFTASFFFFNEIFTPLKIIAILLIIGGVILLNLGTTSPKM